MNIHTQPEIYSCKYIYIYIQEPAKYDGHLICGYIMGKINLQRENGC